MPLSLSLKTLAWSWGVLLTACAAGAVGLQVVDVVPAPEAPSVLRAPGLVAAKPTQPLFAAAAATPPAAAPATPAAPVVPTPPVFISSVNALPHPAEPVEHSAPVRQAETLPLPPVPPRVHKVREARESRDVHVWHRPVVRTYASEPQWPAPENPYWRGSPYPEQYYAYREQWVPRQGPSPYYAWPPGE